jgi:alcohol dehydrogenase (NADP+)
MPPFILILCSSSCPKSVSTYNSRYPDQNKTLSQGGYSTAIRAHERFVFPIPSGLELQYAAPMLCAGLTVYSPLVRNGAGYAFPASFPYYLSMIVHNRKGKKVGVVGIGGLGSVAIHHRRYHRDLIGCLHSHFAIQFARALDCEQVVVFSHSDDKQVRIYLVVWSLIAL